MMKIRALVVDDSVVVRRLVSELLSSEPAVEVVGVAANGRIAIEKISQVSPDVVTLDIDMPEMDGLQALVVIRKNYPRLPVIILSALSERGAAVTLDALALGASDYVTKPANVANSSLALAHLRDELLAKVKALCPLGDVPRPDRRRPPGEGEWSVPGAERMANAQRHIDIVAVGVSTGGPNALNELIPVLPADFPVPIVIAQHMPPVFTRILAERLASHASVDVREGVEGGELRPGSVWIAPGGHHMEVAREDGSFRLRLNQDPPENSCRPAVDVLFRSVAKIYGKSALGVVLTGMGQDGLRGCKDMVEAGGQIWVQDEASSVVWGMPGFVARAGLADQIVPLSQLAGAILRRVRPDRTTAGAPVTGRSSRVYLGS